MKGFNHFESYVGSISLYFFWGNYSKGGPCCGIIIEIYRKGAQEKKLYKDTTQRAPKEKIETTICTAKAKQKKIVAGPASFYWPAVKLHPGNQPSKYGSWASLCWRWNCSFASKSSKLLSWRFQWRSRNLLLCKKHHAVRIKAEVPIDAQVSPALPTEGTSEEQMKSSFFPILWAQHAVVIITLKLELLSFKNVSYI
jgi:hypothetical protein